MELKACRWMTLLESLEFQEDTISTFFQSMIWWHKPLILTYKVRIENAAKQA